MHACPPPGQGLTPCCGRSPIEVASHRLSSDPAAVTCRERLAAELVVDADRGESSFGWSDQTTAGCEPGMTVEALAHAVDNASPYPYDLPREVCVFIARQLLEMCDVRARPDHPLWRYDHSRPQSTAQPAPAPVQPDESA